MQTQDPQQPALPQTTDLKQAIAAAQDYLLSIQEKEGYWWAELESNVSITAEVVLLHKLWGSEPGRPLAKVEKYLRSHQRAHGGWELAWGDGGELSTSVEAYMGLRLLGVPASDPALVKARAFILRRGGISKTRIFTKFHLALIGCYRWQGLPSLPAWVMQLEPPFPVNIYELSSWARGSTVPLLVVFDKKPVYAVEPGFHLNELYAEGIENVRWELPARGDWSDAFLWLDKAFKLAESLDAVPFRAESLQRAEKWIVERQEATGDWGGIIPAMLNSLLALRALDYDVNDPVVQRGLQAVDNFAVETAETYWVQPCISPVWDTALVMRSLTDSGLSSDHPALVKAGEWLLNKQILSYGDWAIKNPQGEPGGWAFEFENRFYPDVDDTAVVAMALQAVTLPDDAGKRRAIARAVRWIATMQCSTGGWAAFDINNDQDWLNDIPYGDLRAMIDPSTADITARVLEMHSRLTDDAALTNSYATALTPLRLSRGLDYLLQEQEADGSWFGRWGVNYIYGTSGALSALAMIAPDRCQLQIERGLAWLVSCQNTDGGWGETCQSYQDASLKGQGPSTASQTAWALIGLLDAAFCLSPAAKTAVQKGVAYLLSTQRKGTWEEDAFTGTGFPQHFYLRYRLYCHYFPLTALGRYQQSLLSHSNGNYRR
ncbi:squalene--hopene cyclase [Leptolyngbya sp. BC1307]|uniref:squalene--hopene cyclase n=1 Tax=Leptolyngbya sp. BC1307 TaxID=2029589 RepID=UPI000EFD8E7F|nr:squalene--hopene cyclase [Leptolyngbya sp. BC1307]